MDARVTGLPLDWPAMKPHLRFARDIPEVRDLVMSYVAEAVDHAEEAMQCSLMPRTIEATYDTGEEIVLARGPIIEVVSVEDAAGNSIAYTRRNVGNRSTLTVTAAAAYPLTVVYRAGYAVVPPRFLGAIRTDAATRYLIREGVVLGASVADVAKLDAFYRANSRGVPIA